MGMITNPEKQSQADDGWVSVRRGGKLLFRYNPQHMEVEIVRRGKPEIVRLTEYHQPRQVKDAGTKR